MKKIAKMKDRQRDGESERDKKLCVRGYEREDKKKKRAIESNAQFSFLWKYQSQNFIESAQVLQKLG